MKAPERKSLVNVQNVSIEIYHWACDSPKALVVLTHGLAGYALRYQELTLLLQSSGIAVVGVDLTGHGHSGGMRGYVEDFQHYVEDYGLGVDYIIEKYGDSLPLFSFGHSMGATVSAHYVLQNQERFTGSVLMGIAMYVTDSVPSILVSVSKLVSRLWPTLPAAKLDSSLTSTDADKVDSYRKDPLIYNGRVRARTGYTFMVNAEALKAKVNQFKIPLLILHGEKDGLCNPEGSRHLYRESASTDKILTIYPNLYHEILNENQGGEIMMQIKDWVISRI